MSYTEQNLLDAGLSATQARLLRQQHTHLRNEGNSLSLDALALRSRFVSEDRLDTTEDQQALIGSGRMVSSLLPLDVCKRYQCIPTDFSKGTLTLSCAQMLQAQQLERVRALLPNSVSAIKLRAASRLDVLQKIAALEQGGTPLALISALKKQGLEAGLLRRLVYAVLNEALSLRASDIHLSKKADPDAWVAYRIDSVMHQTHLLPQLLMQSLVARIKIEAGMDASNSRTAQDGRLALDYQGRVVDFRISSQPLVDGESLVLRALDASQLPGVNTLFPHQPNMLKLIKSITNTRTKGGGLVLVTGATGSGKSTTQYTLSCGFARDMINVITVEDPVEYLLPFAKQIQLQALIQQKAVELERSILRQDPDVLVFGEIRDADSARAALAFAESGHLVISTLHANNVLQVPERFMSIIHQDHRSDAQFLLAHYLKVVIHQKLVKKLCTCCQPAKPSELDLVQQQALQWTGGLIKPTHTLRVKSGCQACFGTGYRGRVAAHETLHVPPEEGMRDRFVKAMNQGALELPADLTEHNGVDFVPRYRTLEVLLNAGLVDWDTTCQALGLGLVTP